MTKKKPKTKKR